MVQLYNPKVVSKQIVIDFKDIESGKLKNVENIQPFLDKIVETLKLLHSMNFMKELVLLLKVKK